MTAADLIARALFEYEAQPETAEIGDRMWARIAEKHGTNSEWYREAQAVTEALGLVEETRGEIDSPNTRTRYVTPWKEQTDDRR